MTPAPVMSNACSGTGCDVVERRDLEEPRRDAGKRSCKLPEVGCADERRRRPCIVPSALRARIGGTTEPIAVRPQVK